MIIEDISQLLEDEGLGTQASDLFVGDITARTENGLYLLNAPSIEPNPALEIYEQVIDFWTRFKTTKAGYAKLEAVQSALHQRANYELDNYHVYFSHSLGAIEDMDRDIERRKLWKLSIRFKYRPLVAEVS